MGQSREWKRKRENEGGRDTLIHLAGLRPSTQKRNLVFLKVAGKLNSLKKYQIDSDKSGKACIMSI